MSNKKVVTDVRSETLGQLLQTRDFEVPINQRSYSWKEEAKEFILDIIEQGSREEYFIGPMVLTSKGRNKYVVIDGQQRLITTCLFLAALRDYLINMNYTKFSNRIHSLFLMRHHDVVGNEKLSVIPNKIDRQFYEKIITIKEGSLQKKERELRKLLNDKKYTSWNNMLTTYVESYKIIDREIKKNNQKIEEWLSKIVDIGIKENIITVVVEVDSEHNAFLIFETLNARGLTLAPLDLIKNYLLGILSNSEDQTQVIRFDEKWNSFLSEYESRELKYVIRYYLIYKYDFVREKDIFKEIKKRINNLDDVRQFFDELERFLNIYYRNISAPSKIYWKKETIVDYLTTLFSIGIRQHIPIMFALLEKYADPKGNINDKEIEKKLKPLYYTLIRRTICSKSPSEFEKKIRRLIELIENNNTEKYYQELRNLFPEDNEFKQSLLKFLFKERKHERLAKALLFEIESSENTKRPSKDLTLEHIYPISRRDKLDNPELVYKIGNLTLLEEDENIKLGSKNYNEKEETYKKSGLALNTKYLVDKYKKWSGEEIEKRTSLLAGILANIIK